MNAVNVPIHSRTREKCCSDARAEMKSAEKCRDANASFLLSADVTRMFPTMSHARSALNGFNQRAICVKLRNWCIRVSICETRQRDQGIMTAQDSKLGDTDDKIFVGKGSEQAWLTLAFANRHGLVTGATGTGKTVSLQVMAEGFARAGVPVFAADIKGDLSGISEVGEAKDFIVKRATEMGLTFQPDQFSTVFWDVFGEQGHPVRATVTEMGPLLLSRMLDLNDVQEGVLNVAFRVADENGLALIDMKDLRALLDAIVPGSAKNGEEDALAPLRKPAQAFGKVTKATVGTI